MLTFEFDIAERWPPNAWIVRLRKGESVVKARCGARIEFSDQWFCEAVWDGEFAEADFDETDVIAGSGCRIRDETLQLVSSGSTVDRLQYIVDSEDTWVSNSLPLLLESVDAAVSPSYSNYVADFNSIVAGIDRYHRVLRTSKGDVQFIYYRNLQWRANGALDEVEKADRKHRLDTFEDYETYLKSSMAKVMANMRDPARKYPYSPLGTLSTGYDSTTVTALAKPFGLEQVICFERDGKRDSGSQIAHHFGVEPLVANVSGWLKLDKPEVPFLAANAIGEEVHYSALSDELLGRVVLTGYHGDKVWDRDTPYVSPDIKRGDISGLALTEFRLWAGFINCPIPFWAVRQLDDINRISRAEEMKPWDVGGDYTRPICRKLVESIGVPRDAFGISKSYASRWFVQENENITKGSFESCVAYVERNAASFWKKLNIPPSRRIKFDEMRLRALTRLCKFVVRLPGFYRVNADKWPFLRNLVALKEPNPPHAAMIVGIRAYYFPWAIEQAKQRYQTTNDGN